MEEGPRLAGSELAGYRIEGLLGRGGMGEVYRAIDVRLGRPVALKVLAPRIAEDEALRERFLTESRLAASLDHPNVVPIYEAGDAEGRLFISMRYVEGQDLKARLRSGGALPDGDAIGIFDQLADALDAAHRRGLVHRDVKPSNVLLDTQDERLHCYLADFGLTQSASHRGPADGQSMGTVDYVSPEQIRGDEVDGRADQYGLACLMFECLTGTVPYRNRSEVAALYAHLEEPVPKASERNPELPTAIDAVFERGMAQEREDRYESCDALVEAARDALGLAPAEPPGRRRLVFATAAVALALMTAGILVALLGGGDSASAAAATGSLISVDPATEQVTDRTDVDGYPGQLAVTPGGIWMADFRGGVLWRYQPGADSLEQITSNGEPRDLALLGDDVYVAADGRFLSGIISRYDAQTGVREDGIDLLACAVASGEGVVWVAGCPYVQRLSTDERRLRTTVEAFLPYLSPATASNSRVQFREMAIGEGSVWVLGDALDPRLWRLDARTGEVEKEIRLPFPPTSIEVAEGQAWITDAVHDEVVPVDAATNRLLDPIPVGRGASGIAVGEGSLWIANTIDGTLSRIDPATGSVEATVEVGGTPRGIAVGDGAVWVTDHAS